MIETKLKAVVADNQPLFRAGLRGMLLQELGCGDVVDARNAADLTPRRYALIQIDRFGLDRTEVTA